MPNGGQVDPWEQQPAQNADPWEVGGASAGPQLSAEQQAAQRLTGGLISPAGLQPAFAATPMEQSPWAPAGGSFNPFSAAPRTPAQERIVGALNTPEAQSAMAVLPMPGEAEAGPLGKLLKQTAGGFAESALDVTSRMRGRGRTIGQAVLEQTQGIRPEAVRESVEGVLGRLTAERDMAIGQATNAGLTGSNTGAKQVLNGLIAAVPRNAPEFAAKLQELAPKLELGTPGQTRYTPTELQEMKAGIDKAIKAWGPEWRDPRGMGKEVDAATQQLYGAIDRELDRLVPGHAQANQVLSSLIPASSQALSETLQAPTSQRVMTRLARPTGALIGALAGGHEGERRYGLPGYIAGTVGGLVLPEMLSSSGGQMAIARALQGAGESRPALSALRAAGLMTARPNALGRINTAQ